MMKVKNKKRFVFLILLIAMIVVVFLLSNQSSEVSHQISNRMANSINIQQKNDWTDASSQKLILGLSLRKYAHIALYFIMGILAFFVVPNRKRSFERPLIAIAICYLCSVFDEIHQYFVPSRTAEFTDTLIDAIGFTISILICWCIGSIIIKKGHKNTNC